MRRVSSPLAQPDAEAPLPFERVDFRRMSAEALEFRDSSFDLVTSSAVWEHIADVQAATAEANRVLRPGGLTVIQIALFPSLQGDHNAEWHSPRRTRAAASSHGTASGPGIGPRRLARRFVGYVGDRIGRHGENIEVFAAKAGR
jgi:SAM-dependent methyltransferase